MIHFCNMLLSVIKLVHTAQKASLPVHLSYHRNVLLPEHISRRFLPHPSWKVSFHFPAIGPSEIPVSSEQRTMPAPSWNRPVSQRMARSWLHSSMIQLPLSVSSRRTVTIVSSQRMQPWIRLLWIKYRFLAK